MILAAVLSTRAGLDDLTAVKHLSFEGFWESERMRVALALGSPLLIRGSGRSGATDPPPSDGVTHVRGQARRVLPGREEAPLLEAPQALVDLSAQHQNRGFLQLLINSPS